MDDLISRKLAIRAIANYINFRNDIESCEKTATNMLEDVPAILTWISCKCELPDYNIDVLVYANVQSEKKIYIASLHKSVGMSKKYWLMNDGCIFNFADILAWMELPKEPIFRIFERMADGRMIKEFE